MYNLPHYSSTGTEDLVGFMRRHSFATLCGSSKNGPVATQVPMLVDERDEKIFLTAHVMRRTDHHLAFEEDPRALALFQGPHCYVSASWYSDPSQASTWNYMTVHARGELKFLDESGLHDVLRRTTRFYEDDPASPSLYDALSEEYIGRLSKAIIAFEIEVTDLQHVFKLSQNRDEASYRNIIDRLDQRPDEASRLIAGEMKDRVDRVFKIPHDL